jgi:hypothetical protein
MIVQDPLAMVIVAYAVVSLMTALVTTVAAVLLTSLSLLEIVGCAILAANLAPLGLAVLIATSRSLNQGRNHVRCGAQEHSNWSVMRKKDWSKKRWNTGVVAYLGALLGMLIAGAHVFWHVLQGNLPSEDPLFHITVDLIAGTLGVASLFGSVSSFRNWLMRA